MNLLEMKHIKKEFDGLEVIHDISLSVEEGEVLAIIGPSGSGKSTMLRCAAMLEKIDGGEICYLGKRAAWVDENGKQGIIQRVRRHGRCAPVLVWYFRISISFPITVS